MTPDDAPDDFPAVTIDLTEATRDERLSASDLEIWFAGLGGNERVRDVAGQPDRGRRA
jgi:hypothetical protein